MSLHPDSVEQLLERDGERWRSAFSPPPLAGMLAVAAASPRHRARWIWPLAAAVLLLVIPLATVAGTHHSHKPSAPATNRSIGYLGNIDWADAVLLADGRTMTISADINHTPEICLDYGLPNTRAVVSETATAVTITVQAFRPSHPSPTPSVQPGSVLGCSAVGYLAPPLTIRLSQPLGSRTLIDATTGHHHPVLRASTLLTPTYLPAGYVDQGIQWHEELQQPQVLHDYTGPGVELRVVRGYGFRAESDQQTLGTGTVLGHPAKVIQNTNLPGRICVLWDDPEYSWSICSDSHTPGARRAPLDAAELLRIGNSMR